MKKKKEKKKGSPIGAIIVIVLGLLLSNIDNSDALPIIVGAAVLGVAVFIVVTFAKAAKKKAAEDKPRSYTPPVSYKTSSAVKDACDYGTDNCGYSHDEQRRVQQLNNFLKNGTIDRNEYRVLLERYRREVEAANIHRS